jgi:hypothetical protein
LGKFNAKTDTLLRDIQHQPEKTGIDLTGLQFKIKEKPLTIDKISTQLAILSIASSLKQVQFTTTFIDLYKENYIGKKIEHLWDKIGTSNIFEENGLFYIENCLNPSENLWLYLIEEEHTSVYWGREKTLDHIRWNFNVPQLDKKVRDDIKIQHVPVKQK